MQLTRHIADSSDATRRPQGFESPCDRWGLRVSFGTARESTGSLFVAKPLLLKVVDQKSSPASPAGSKAALHLCSLLVSWGMCGCNLSAGWRECWLPDFRPMTPPTPGGSLGSALAAAFEIEMPIECRNFHSTVNLRLLRRPKASRFCGLIRCHCEIIYLLKFFLVVSKILYNAKQK